MEPFTFDAWLFYLNERLFDMYQLEAEFIVDDISELENLYKKGAGVITAQNFIETKYEKFLDDVQELLNFAEVIG